MPNKYTGTPLESDWERLQRRRELNNALVAQSLAPYQGSQMVSGRVVQDSLGRGIGKIGTALIGALQNRELAKEGKELGERYTEGRQKAMDEVKAALSPERTNYVEREAPGPDLLRAATAYQSPYLQNDAIARSLINTAAYGGDKGRSGYSRVFAGKDGTLYQKDMRDPSAPATMLTDSEGNPLYDPRYTPESQYNLKGAGEEAVQQQKTQYEPQRAEETARRKVHGASRGQAEVDLPKTEESYDKSIALIDELITHPGFEDAVGFPDNPFTMGGLVPWTNAAGFRKRLDQLTGRGFMEVFPTLKGGGQITEIEGQKAQESINRMSTATNEKEFLSAAEDFKRELFRLKKIVADRAGAEAGAPPETKDDPLGIR